MTDQHQPSNWYPGSYNQMIEQLIRDEGVPFSISDLIMKRKKIQQTPVISKSRRNRWLLNAFGSDDGIAYNTNGDIKIVLNAPYLREITTESRLCRGGLVLPEGAYEDLKAAELTKDEVYQCNHFETSIKENLPAYIVWSIVARDSHLLMEYFNIFHGYNGNRNNMRIFIEPYPDVPEEQGVPIIRPLVLGGIDHDRGLYTVSLTDPSGILVGKFTPNDNLETRL